MLGRSIAHSGKCAIETGMREWHLCPVKDQKELTGHGGVHGNKSSCLSQRLSAAQCNVSLRRTGAFIRSVV